MWSIWPWLMNRKSWEIARCGHLPMSNAILSEGNMTQVSCPPIDSPSTGYPSTSIDFFSLETDKAGSLPASLVFLVLLPLPIAVSIYANWLKISPLRVSARVRPRSRGEETRSREIPHGSELDVVAKEGGREGDEERLKGCRTS
ncbi:hypothetical protein B296_00037138 [Ensete ventricosum]|uniref:Uncharacterized protein n=1 Tax=Ensete ventricosum TaxID=4639 RepID=A0A427A0F5_ENSVE|nr:hypothetical protein B296_00037138 [Ensete ventricosum]